MKNIKILIFERQKWAKLKMYFKGKKDYRRGKFGKIEL
jgi:hypothetical protein